MDNYQRKDKIKFILFIIAIVLIWYFSRYFHIDIQALNSYLGKIPRFYSGAFFVILYVAMTFFIWFSKDILRILAALLFGPLTSTIFVFVGETINAFILFNFSRLLGRGFVEGFLKNRYKSFNQRLAEVNLFWLITFRMAPLIPFRFLDLAAGLTRISFKKYLVAVILGSPIRIFWLQYILAGVGEGILKEPRLIVNYLTSHRVIFVATFIYLILVILVAFKIKIKE